MSPLLDRRLDLTMVSRRVEAVADSFLTAKGRDLHLVEFAELLRSYFAAGGKRIRPLLCVVGWHAAGAEGDDGVLLRWAASLELFHLFALIHDDVMDDSDSRRGRPSVHREMASRWPQGAGAGAERFGRHSAILLGDLALVWAEELLRWGSPVEGLGTAWELVDRMRSELVVGQYLDLASTGRMNVGVEAALRIARLKTAKYTVERPLQIGAALGGADRAVLDECSVFALPLGEAFQLRDDLLGVFGDSKRSGKPVLDDLRQGKPTVLLALARERAGAREIRVLDELVGNPELDEEGSAVVRDVLITLGAPQTVESMITHRHRAALDALDAASFTPAATAALREITQAVVARSV